MRNDRFSVALRNDCGQFMRYVKPDVAFCLVAKGTAHVVAWGGEKLRRVKAIALSPPSCLWRIDTVAVKRSDPRNVLQPRTQTPDDFIPGFCRG
jgi:hypothetical protein